MILHCQVYNTSSKTAKIKVRQSKKVFFTNCLTEKKVAKA